MANVLSGYRQRKAASLEPVIGATASVCAARTGEALAGLAVMSALVLGSIMLTQLVGGPILLGVTLVFAGSWLTCAYLSNRFNRMANRLAREWVSKDVGYDVGTLNGVVAKSSWVRTIERAKARHTAGPGDAARSAEWLAKKQQQWDEYRRQKPNGDQ